MLWLDLFIEGKDNNNLIVTPSTVFLSLYFEGVTRLLMKNLSQHPLSFIILDAVTNRFFISSLTTSAAFFLSNHRIIADVGEELVNGLKMMSAP
jgi:hypothetical protein